MSQQTNRRFRFRLQSMLVIITAISIVFGLLMREVHAERRKKQIIEAIVKNGGSVRFFDLVRDGQAPKGFFKDWVRVFLGDDYFTAVKSLGFASESTTLDEVIDCVPELQMIGIGARHVTDASLKKLPTLSTLNEVLIVDGKITDSGLDSLSRVPLLRQLRFKECTIKDGSDTPLARCPSLKLLSFEKCELSKSILKSIQDIPNLTVVEFENCTIDDSLLSVLHGSPNKLHLELNNCNVTEAGILALRTENPNWAIRYTDATVAKLKDQPNRDWTKGRWNFYPRSNSISDVFGLKFGGDLVTDATLIALANATNLRELRVTLTAQGSITSKGIEALQGLEFLSSLYLNFSQCTDAEVGAIAKLQKLQVLSLWGCPVTDAAVEELSKLKSLKRLFVGETAISESGLEQLQAALPNCEIVSKNE